MSTKNIRVKDLQIPSYKLDIDIVRINIDDVVQSDFDSYTVTYLGGRQHLTGTTVAVIQCYKGNDIAGFIHFWPNDSYLPENQYEPRSNRDSTPVPYLNYNINRFADVISLLRYEKPLSLVLNTKTMFGYIGTKTLEPVGEQE